MNLNNKAVLITGGNSGLGFELAKQLMAKGCKVTILGKDVEKLKKAKELLLNEVDVIECNLKSYEEIKLRLSKIEQIDILINNAGIIAYQKLEEHDPENIKDIIETNLLGTIFTTRELFSKFKEQNSGTIVNVVSTSGLMTGGHAYESVYMSSKYGISGFTEALKKEVNEEKINVRVLGFYPGGMRTELFSKSGDNKDTSKFMDPKEVAEVLVFMLERPDSIMMDHVIVNRNKNSK